MPDNLAVAEIRGRISSIDQSITFHRKAEADAHEMAARADDKISHLLALKRQFAAILEAADA